MKIIVAPSKTQKMRRLEEFYDYEIELSHDDLELTRKQTKKTRKLVKTINNHSRETIASKMKLKDKLLDEVIDNFKQFKKTQEGHGILSYTGTVFKELKIEEYGREQVTYMNNHVLILSALYGPIPAFYLIKPYRLDMTMTLFEQNLYKEWQRDSKSWFDDEDIIIDLSSKEFSKLVEGTKLTFEFLQKVNGEYKTIAYHSKQGRGFMLNYLISHRITEIEEIKNFDIEAYKFDQKRSSKFNYVFVRELVLKNK